MHKYEVLANQKEKLVRYSTMVYCDPLRRFVSGWKDKLRCLDCLHANCKTVSNKVQMEKFSHGRIKSKCLSFVGAVLNLRFLVPNEHFQPQTDVCGEPSKYTKVGCMFRIALKNIFR